MSFSTFLDGRLFIAHSGSVVERADVTKGWTVERTVHGPFERLSFTHPRRLQHSVYRIGDTLVDTGGTLVADVLLRVLAERPPRRIVLTHQHEDHVGNVGAIRRAFGAAIPVHAPRELVGVIAATTEVPRYRARAFGQPEATPAAELEPYDPGASFAVAGAGVTLEAVLTPGHTPHHIALCARAGDEVFALTADLYTSRPLEAWYESAADDMVASLRRVAAVGPALRVLPTHGRVKDDGARVLASAADWLEREADEVRADAARRGLGAADARALAGLRYAALGEDPMDALSGGEISRVAFVRSVLAPVRTLPATLP